LFGLAVGPFYLGLVVLACLGMLDRGEKGVGRQGDGGTTHESSQNQPETTLCGGHGCGSSGGCGTGACGASSGGACGCSGGSKKASAPKPLPLTPEAKARNEAVQKRNMAIPVANYPGIGPNAPPLPAGLIPNPNAVLPPGAQKLLDAAKSGPPTQPPGTAPAPPAATSGAAAPTPSAAPAATAVPVQLTALPSTAPAPGAVAAPAPATPPNAPAAPINTPVATPPPVPVQAASSPSTMTPVAPADAAK